MPACAARIRRSHRIRSPSLIEVEPSSHPGVSGHPRLLDVVVMDVDVSGRGRKREILEHPEMRTALAVRDVATVYRILQKHGVSQRRIATLAEQSQSEISEILAGRRVSSYDVLARIADGLGVPRGWMGLAFDADAELAP
jgi:predicted XRE-type DNA-binding protein